MFRSGKFTKYMASLSIIELRSSVVSLKFTWSLVSLKPIYQSIEGRHECNGDIFLKGKIGVR